MQALRCITRNHEKLHVNEVVSSGEELLVSEELSSLGTALGHIYEYCITDTLYRHYIFDNFPLPTIAPK